MLIPKCCKNCANKGQLKFGTGCMCDAPIRCGELVEDDEDIKRYEAMAKSAPQLGNWVKCPDCEEKDKEIRRLNNVIWGKERYCDLEFIRKDEKIKDKDHRIAVLELALWLACEDLQFFDYGEESTEEGEKMKFEYFIEQAEKELEGKE